MCICGVPIPNNYYPNGWRSFCSGTCAARAAAAVAYAERAQAFLAGLVVAFENEEAATVLVELRHGLTDVRKGPNASQ